MKHAEDDGPSAPLKRKRRRLAVDHLMLEPTVPAAGQTLQDAVYEQLRAALMIGSFSPGEALSVRSLAEILRVSETPVKDALRRLAADGVLRAQPQSAFAVSTPSRSRYLDIIDARMKLEPMLTARAALIAEPSTIKQLEKLNAAYLTARKTDLLKINFSFHFTIYDAAAAPDVRDLILISWMRIGVLLSLINAELEPSDDYAMHARIIEAIADRNPDAAATAMADHIRSTAERVTHRISD